MEFPSLGDHCGVASCSKLDFLPFECDCCHKIFCKEHRGYEDHRCSESYVKDIHVPVCPLCNKPLPIRSGIDPNVVVNEHIMRDCEEQKKKLYTNKCMFPGCKKKELVPVTCMRCHLNYCLKHRLESDHNCDEYVKKKSLVKFPSSLPYSKYTSGKVKSSTTGKPQETLMSQIGADLNRERLERQKKTNVQDHSLSHRVYNGDDVSEDDALHLALAASITDLEGSVSQEGSISHHRAPECSSQECQNIEEDEALARAIAASLNEAEKSRTNSGDTDKNTGNCVIS